MKTLIDLIDDRIVIDILETWPNQIFSYIRKKEEIIKYYLQLDHDIELKQRSNPDLRVFIPENKYQKEYIEIANNIDNELSKFKFVGFHCTNLISWEVISILKEGLEPLSPDLVKKKLKILKENDIIDSEQYYFLLSNNLANENNRRDMAWFFLCSSTLKYDQSGLIHLLSLWGGESIYRTIEQDYGIEEILKSIGKPSIVLLDLSYNDYHCYSSETLAQRMIKIYMNRNINNEKPYDSDCNKRENISVIDIISSDDDLFEELTGFSSWRGR